MEMVNIEKPSNRQYNHILIWLYSEMTHVQVRLILIFIKIYESTLLKCIHNLKWCEPSTSIPYLYK